MFLIHTTHLPNCVGWSMWYMYVHMCMHACRQACMCVSKENAFSKANVFSKENVFFKSTKKFQIVWGDQFSKCTCSHVCMHFYASFESECLLERECVLKRGYVLHVCNTRTKLCGVISLVNMYARMYAYMHAIHICKHMCIAYVYRKQTSSRKRTCSPQKKNFHLGMYARKSMCVFSQASAFNDTVHMRKETCKVVAFYVRVRENVFSLENVFLEKIVSLFADISIQWWCICRKRLAKSWHSMHACVRMCSHQRMYSRKTIRLLFRT